MNLDDMLDSVVDDAAAPSSTNLPDSFWQARPKLAQIRQAAHSRMVSPDAVLGVVLARVALVTPCGVVLPALVGSTAPLNTLTALVAASGAGKGATVDVAAELLPIAIDDLVADFTLGSGEGIVAAYLGDVIELDANGKNKKVQKQVIRGVLAITDEGQVLAEFASRKGSTLMPTLRSAWSGKTLGQGNASVETNRRIPAGAYRFVAVVALQKQYAMSLLDDAGGGTPQRILWLSAEDPTMPYESPEWPNILTFTPPTRYTHSQTPMRVAEPIAAEIRARRHARVRGELVNDDPLDSHADLVRLKVAALLAILDERLDVSVDDWALAGTMMATSKAVRRSVAMSAQLDARHRETASNERNVRRVIAEVDGVERHALNKAAATMQRHAQRSTADTLSAAELWRATSSADRKIVSQSDVIEHAISLGYLVAEADGYRAAA